MQAEMILSKGIVITLLFQVILLVPCAQASCNDPVLTKNLRFCGSDRTACGRGDTCTWPCGTCVDSGSWDRTCPKLCVMQVA
uniref:Putative secreted protein n=1 Tax=Amblyomma tuberculatum TaxID=48802 RepID=A0A6M2E289_9ACAR